MQDFRKLKVWERSHLLTFCVYELTRRFPKEEMFGLTSQLRRAAVSVELNLAEPGVVVSRVISGEGHSAD